MLAKSLGNMLAEALVNMLTETLWACWPRH